MIKSTQSTMKCTQDHWDKIFGKKEVKTKDIPLAKDKHKLGKHKEVSNLHLIK